MWVPDQFLKELYEEALPIKTKRYDDNWKKHLKQQFTEVLGDFPKTQEDFDVKQLERVEFEDFTRIRIELKTCASLKLPAYVLFPKNNSEKKRSAVLALHGHGYGSKEIVGLKPDGIDNLHEEPGIHKNFAVELVRRGQVVIAPELIGFGERILTRDIVSEAPPSQNSCFGIASQLLLVGKTLAGLRVAECRRVIDYLSELPEVDSERIGIMGLSGGGLVASYTSALDERIKATVICGYTNTFKGSIIDRNHCLDNYVPGILQIAEMPELIGLIAPRALFIESGIEDDLFPIDQVKVAVERIEVIYEAFNTKTNIASDYFQGKHEVSGEKSFDWLVDKLNS